MNAFENLWLKLREKKYREQFVAAQLKQGIPFQIGAILNGRDMTQEDLARLSGLTQGVISRAADLDYGNLTINTIIRIAAGFDLAFVGRFVPFSELARWFLESSERSLQEIPTFDEQDLEFARSSVAVPIDVQMGSLAMAIR